MILAVILYGTLRILVSMSYTYLAEDLFKFKESDLESWKSSPDEESTVNLNRNKIFAVDS